MYLHQSEKKSYVIHQNEVYSVLGDYLGVLDVVPAYAYKTRTEIAIMINEEGEPSLAVNTIKNYINSF